MCIVFIALEVHPRYPLIVASNCDKYLDRPSESMRMRTGDGDARCGANDGDLGDNDVAASQPQEREGKTGRRRSSLSGRDLVRGGTWPGITLPGNSPAVDSGVDGEGAEDGNREGAFDVPAIALRWIAITNFREREEDGRPSRGRLLAEYLEGDGAPLASSFVRGLRQRGQEYNGFNLLAGDETGIYYYGNRTATDDGSTGKAKPLSRGIHGLSNGVLDDAWPKVKRGKSILRSLCVSDFSDPSSSIEYFHERLVRDLLCDKTQPPGDDELPRTHLDPSEERNLSSIFVPQCLLGGREYGTRTSTTIVVDAEGRTSVLERTWHPEREDQRFRFDSGGGMRGTLA